MLSSLLKALILVILTTAMLLLIGLWSVSASWAVTALLGVLFAYSGAIALQCAVLLRVNRLERGPKATASQIVGAWWRETVVAARVFLWWQPFFTARYPDQVPACVEDDRATGVVLIHGFVCNRAVWSRWLSKLQGQSIPFIAVDLEPLFGSIDEYASTIDRAVESMRLSTGRAPLIVCHSMGGLAVRAWLRATNADRRVHHIVTIGSPHGGTKVGNWLPELPWPLNASQMRHESHWLKTLASQESTERRARFTCFYSNCDNIVTPASTATLPDADNRFVDGVPHLALVMDDDIMAQALQLRMTNFPSEG